MLAQKSQSFVHCSFNVRFILKAFDIHEYDATTTKLS